MFVYLEAIGDLNSIVFLESWNNNGRVKLLMEKCIKQILKIILEIINLKGDRDMEYKSCIGHRIKKGFCFDVRFLGKFHDE